MFDEEKTEDMQIVVFRLGAEEYGADISQVREIIEHRGINSIPGTTADLHGVINLRGQITTVIDLRKRLGIREKASDSSSRIIIAEVEGNTIGMIVDSVSEVRYVSGSQIEPFAGLLHGETGADYVSGICKLKTGLLILLNLEKVFDRTAVSTITAS